MSTPVTFDYDIFYKFYTQKKLPWERNPPRVKFIDDFQIKQKQKQGRFMWFLGTKMYIDTVPMSGKMLKRGLVFSMLRYVNNELWDDHFYFGISDGMGDFGIPSIIYFHKTVQDIETSVPQKRQNSCWFPSDQDIRNIELIKCINYASKQMASSDKFPITKSDFRLIKEIIQRPFLHLLRGQTPAPTNSITNSKTTSGGKKTRSKVQTKKPFRKTLRRIH
jgi:hypothetical protein